MFAFFVSLVLWLGHHHLAELVEVHRAGAVLVELLKYELLGFCAVSRTKAWKAHITTMETSELHDCYC